LDNWNSVGCSVYLSVVVPSGVKGIEVAGGAVWA